MQDSRGLLIGELAVRAGLLTEQKLDACVQQQIDERHRRPLGEIMIELGLIPRAKLQELLDGQRREIEAFEHGAESRHLFGRTAVSKGFVTPEKLVEATRAQARGHARGSKIKLGQIMLELGFMTVPQFWEVLHEQGDFICGTCSKPILKPWFRGSTVVCEHCMTPAFSVTPSEGGPKPKRRKRTTRR